MSASSYSKHIPNEYICPITLEIMENPVTISDGLQLNGAAIKEWFDLGHTTSPSTNEQVDTSIMIPNISVRNIIKDWVSVNKDKNMNDGIQNFILNYLRRITESNEVFNIPCRCSQCEPTLTPEPVWWSN